MKSTNKEEVLILSGVPEESIFKDSVDFGNLNFFHTRQAINFFNSCGFTTNTVVVKRNTKVVAIVCAVIHKEKGLKSFFSRRAIIYGGPVFSDDITSEEITLLLSNLLATLKKKVIYIEIRNFNSYENYRTLFKELGFEYNAHLNFHLKCSSDLDEVNKRMSKSTIRNIKRGLKEGGEIFEAQGIDDVIEYYEVLDHLYKTRVKTPLPGLDFFQTIYEQGIGKFLLVRYEGKVIGGGLFVVLEGKTVYEWFVCGLDRENRKVYPSTLATWAGIEYASVNGYELFDFMGAGKPDEAYGVRDFKSRFGGEQVEHGRFLYIANSLLYKLGKKVIAFIKK